MTSKDNFSTEASRFLVILVIIIVVIGLILAGYNVDWTGFNLYVGPHGQPYQPAKTLWDWMQLLIVPAVLAGGGFSITYLRDRNKRKIATDRLQAASLQEYLDRMSELLLKENLRKSEPYTEVRHVARAQTLTVLRGLDPVRKGSLVQFLHESSLIRISATNSIIDLKGVDLSRADFRRTNLSQVNLSGVNLSEANLASADLSGADLSGAYLRAADLRKTNLKGTNLFNAKLREANLEGADLHEADLSGADLSGINLSGADLSEADLRMAIVHRFEMFFIPVANHVIPLLFPLKETNLSGTNLREAKLTYASLRRVNLSRATLDKADINEVNLREANLSKADLHDANLSKSKLRKTNLSEANLSKANLSRANLHGVDLRGANLQDATGITIARLEKEAKSLAGATMPNGSRYP